MTSVHTEELAIQGDVYPSRNNGAADILPRLDPVVYSESTQKSPIDFALIEQYKEQGFLVLENIFDEEEVSQYKEELNRLRKNQDIRESPISITEPASGELRSVFQVHETSPIFKTLASDERLTDIAKYILDDKIYVHQSRLNYKPGFHGKDFYWHSDFETWHVEDGMPRMRALSMSIALAENFVYNGPLMLVPGSHKFYVSCEGETPKNHFETSLKKQEYGVPNEDQLTSLIDKGGIVTATCKPGSVIIFDCNTMHGSNSNISSQARSNVFFVYNACQNKVQAPYSTLQPRPEHICSRKSIKPIGPK